MIHDPRPEREELIEPTEDERKNGWDAATLTAYVREQRRAQEARLQFQSRPRPRPQVQNGGFRHSGGRIQRPSWQR